MNITPKLLHVLACKTATKIEADLGAKVGTLRAFGIPRGGVCAALSVAAHTRLQLVDSPEEADLLIDDLVDSGSTEERYKKLYPNLPLYVLIDKRHDEQFKGKWIVFPWEHTEENSIEDNIRRVLQYIGENPGRGGLLETPHRVAKAYKHWFSGYGKDPKDVLKVFEDGAENHDQMITVRNIPIYSFCEHHMAPIFGTATIAYIPNGKIVGLSKLSRLADIFARRLQVQERLTDQIADALFEHLGAKGVGVAIKARHMCMESRGVCQQGHDTVTTALRGAMREEKETRAEFLALVR